ncbi:MAG: DUF3144 domain-containing protein [Chromatiaceae bacterium]|nr:DUF3144 domain-containing protein [Chromatiaceae bacterium]
MQEDVFHEVADEFINLANQMSEDWATPMLSAAFMYAAARFNAFHAIGEGADRETRKRAIVYLCDQYRKMLEENLRELRQSQSGLRTDDF